MESRGSDVRRGISDCPTKLSRIDSYNLYTIGIYVQSPSLKKTVELTDHRFAVPASSIPLLAACRRERNRSHASRSASACVVDGTSRSTRKERGRRQNRDGDGGPMTWKGPHPRITPRIRYGSA